MLVLVSTLLVLLLAMTLFTVDASYMQLTRSELRAATDAATKAGAEALRRTQDEDEARNAAITVASRNTVGGQPLVLRPEDVLLGRTVQQGDGTWTFQEGARPYTAVHVDAAMGGTSANGPVNLFFAGMFGSNTFEPKRSATASSMETEICLVIDRSGSMCYDLSGESGRYPSGGGYLLPPDPQSSRWAALMRSVKLFLSIAKKQEPPPRLSLVTWASDVNVPGSLLGILQVVLKVVVVESGLSPNWGPLQQALDVRSKNPMLGRTNLAAGLDAGVRVLTGPNAKPLASKVIILMTDGQWNEGRNPLLAAEDARAAGITVHTITFLETTDTTMEQVAEITGGRYFFAANEAQLQAAFEEIARMIPVVLTE
jgi:Flp pilus assembly protein TadG